MPPYSIGNTWSCDSQIWSGALRNPASCPQQSSLSADEQPPAQYYDRGSSYGYYYNWTCVYENATTLCPSPWRVPTDNDLSTLVSCAEKNHSLDGSLWLGAWGPTGYVATSEFVESPTGHVWSQTAEPPPYAVCLLYDTNGVGIVADYRAVGFPVRCVR
ncbi:MAG: fibrobacter succinogenes major paralogous domain-containing protein [Prevotellaceae bacterium]|nr:fibrobacter succinogenes major paralogous domain-containing protein [Prevotellaceae bacterium]